MAERRPAVEWPTLLLLIACYAVWAMATTVLSAFWLPLGVVALVLSVALHSSLQHEVLHGHPFRSRMLNEALVFLPLGLFFPYGRFRDLHLAHHRDESLTDPYDDPESNYLDPKVWARLPGWLRLILRANNTLLGRMVLGPAISVAAVLRSDGRAILGGDRAIARDWALHAAGLVLVGLWIAATAMPVWAYFVAAYAGMSILKIRTFLEHRAHDLARGRTVIVEDRGPLAFLFLNNNLHVVHHAKPGVAWYRLPALYAANREEFLRRNEGYRYASYGEVFRRHFLTPKDPVPHPLRPGN
ncbi:fatty acid desaturase [Defluviimonas sp. SAOS-178_SWC]|uniref:fatty acid desaturase n=1 Tax=Defluviimonas sp. SAOS-178_SWC TaxID=3121287 RepID=UPI003221B5DF